MWRSVWRSARGFSTTYGAKGFQGAGRNAGWAGFGRRIPAGKWNHMDEMRLFSYSSHLAFWMLLPPVVKMYCTRVEVVRDETLSESPLQAQIEMLKLDPTRPLPVKSILEQDRAAEEGDDCSVILAQVQDSFKKLENGEISLKTYTHTITQISDKLDGNKKNHQGVIEVIFDQLRWTRCTSLMQKMFKRYLVSRTASHKIKRMSIMRSIAHKYEKTKQNQIGREIPLKQLVSQSAWLRRYVKDVERLKQVLMVAMDFDECNGTVVSTILRETLIGPLRERVRANRSERDSVLRVLRQGGYAKQAQRLKDGL